MVSETSHDFITVTELKQEIEMIMCRKKTYEIQKEIDEIYPEVEKKIIEFLE